MLLPKDCITITQDEAKMLLQALGVDHATGIRDIQGLITRNEHLPQISTSLCDAIVRTIYNLLQAVKELDPTEVY